MARHGVEAEPRREASVADRSAHSSGGSSVQLRRAVARAEGFDAQERLLRPDGGKGVQGKGALEGDAVHTSAAHGISGGSGALPFGDRIQRSFGGYDISHVQAHTDAQARMGSASMGADAYATGHHVAFSKTPDLHTAAHEAAHVVQQQAGVQLSGGVGTAGDRYEQHADRVADAVVRGRSAEPILAEMAGVSPSPAGVGAGPVQRQESDTASASTSAGGAAEADASPIDVAASPPEDASETGAGDAEGAEEIAPTQQWMKNTGEPWNSLKALERRLRPKRKALASPGREKTRTVLDRTVRKNGKVRKITRDVVDKDGKKVKWRPADLMITDAHIQQEQRIEGENGYKDKGGVDSGAKAACLAFIDAIRAEWGEKYKDIKKLGIVGSPYRSYSYQVGLFAKKVVDQSGVAARQKNSALPGFSQHHTGRAFDIFSTENGWWDSRADLKAWVIEHAPEFGFKVSYPVETPGRTQEPWHIYKES